MEKRVVRMNLDRIVSGKAPAGNAAARSRSRLVVRAMIAAAGACGDVGAGQRERILERAATLGLTGSARSRIVDELADPPSLEAVARSVCDAETAAEVYAASLLVADTTRPEGRVYLEDLAERLAMSALVVRAIAAELDLREEAA